MPLYLVEIAFTVTIAAIALTVSLAGKHVNVFENVWATRAPLLTAAECDRIVALAEAHAGGWEDGRHEHYADVDISKLVGRTDRAFVEREVLADRAVPLLAGMFGIPTPDIRLLEAFVVKYGAGEAEAHRESGASLAAAAAAAAAASRNHPHPQERTARPTTPPPTPWPCTATRPP
jgi:hypothetical protein